uniref:RGS domain-containing protein n=1 Tax=Anser cygnoides TaxID=8845 RepID=A0A8B9D933_ANSCY
MSGPPCLCSDPLSLPQFFHFLSLSFFPTKSRDPPHFTSLPHSRLVPPTFSDFLTVLLFSLTFPLEPSFTLSPWCPACCCAPWARSTSCCGWRGATWVLISQLPSPCWQLKQMQEKAKEIYMTFLSSKASSQVNVEGQSRLNETILETPHPLMFQKLQDQIFNLMKYDSYSRFLKSDIFLNHKKPEEQEENSPEAQTAAKRASRIYNT